MPKVPPLKAEEVERLLLAFGFRFARQKGSHRRYIHPDGRSTTVPFHKGRDVSPTLIRMISKEIGIAVEDFIAPR